MADVVLKKVSKSYDTKKVIEEVNLEIKDNEFLVLVGSSGCGKSTVLRMIAGLETITEGEIFIDGKHINNVHPKDRDIAMVFQNYALYPHMTVYENIAFPLKMKKMCKAEIDKKVNEAAQILNLEEYLKRKPKQLSGGQRQRVALGRAIVRQPKVFLMDEPLSNLDAKLRVQMRTEIKKLQQKLETTFIYVTHDQTEALTMGDRVAIIDKGVIQQVGKPEDVYNLPANVFVGGFLGSPPMNFVPVEVMNGKINFNGYDINLTQAQRASIEERKSAVAGLRPEKISTGADTKFEARVDAVEMLGSEKIIYFDINGAKCSAKMPIDAQIEDEMTLTFNKSDLLFFDSENTGLLGS